MDGIYFNLEDNDIELTSAGVIKKAEISSQCCALIATSQVCRLTKPEVGEQVAAKIINNRDSNVTPILESAIRAVEDDGGNDVEIYLNDDDQLVFKADYDD